MCFAEHKSKNLIYLLSLKCYAKVNHSFSNVSRTLSMCSSVGVDVGIKGECGCSCVQELEIGISGGWVGGFTKSYLSFK